MRPSAVRIRLDNSTGWLPGFTTARLASSNAVVAFDPQVDEGGAAILQSAVLPFCAGICCHSVRIPYNIRDMSEMERDDDATPVYSGPRPDDVRILHRGRRRRAGAAVRPRGGFGRYA